MSSRASILLQKQLYSISRDELFVHPLLKKLKFRDFLSLLSIQIYSIGEFNFKDFWILNGKVVSLSSI
jgi:hypothetical protein